MLQQTRVETVERYWPAFVARFPDVGTLAAADTDTVLAAWSGLGYYRRARLLHRGAQHVTETLGGTLPSDAAGLLSIPGIGRYTAGAIAAIAHDKPDPLVDGNVARVLSRYEAVESVAEQDATSPWLWDACAAILREGSPRVLGQALMELGATVCTPKSPTCLVCPLMASCRARANNRVAAIPAVRVRKAVPTETLWAIAAVRGDETLLVRRPDEGLLAGLWSLPLLPRDPDEAVPSASAIATVLTGRNAPPRVIGAPVVHVFTHRRWEVAVVRVDAGKSTSLRDASIKGAWIRHGDRPDGGVPTVTAKLLRCLVAADV